MTSSAEQEILFIVARYLENSPFRASAEILIRELEEHKSFPKKFDFQGFEYDRSYNEMRRLYPHVNGGFLVQVFQNLRLHNNKNQYGPVPGVKSFLAAGSASLVPVSEAARRKRKLTKEKNNFVDRFVSRGIIHKIPREPVLPTNLYQRLTFQKRIFCHLSSIFCLAFDRTGRHIISGADDNLIKIWNLHEGRLLCALRGHSKEVSDISVSYDNRLLASAGCDKVIRIWDLKCAAPIAVLHSHNATVTTVKFLPLMLKSDVRWLVSTSTDGSVCFWKFHVANKTFNPQPMKFIERSRAGTQIVCSSCSPGGHFVAIGSTDHVIRVYQFSGVSPEYKAPIKIAELEGHSAEVDTLVYNHNGDRFVSGSKDGTARVWRFEKQEWKSLIIILKTEFGEDIASSTVSRELQKEETVVNRMEVKALYDTDVEEADEVEVQVPDIPDWSTSSSSDSDSSYSDWMIEDRHPKAVNPRPRRAVPTRRTKRASETEVSEDEEEEEEDEEEDSDEESDSGDSDGSEKPTTSRARTAPIASRKPSRRLIKTRANARAQARVQKQQRVQRKRRQARRRIERQKLNEVTSCPPEFQPPEWLRLMTPRHAPYVPQIGDEVLYFRQGHQFYVDAVRTKKIYRVDEGHLPWVKNPSLAAFELVKVIGMKIELKQRPPRLMCLKLNVINQESNEVTRQFFTLKYHDIPDVIDFLVLRQTFEMAINRNWMPGDRFRSMIDDAWWCGKISAVEPLQEEFQGSPFQCLIVQWDNGETERMSPWDLEPIDGSRLPEQVGDSVPVSLEEAQSLLYEPLEAEWHGCSRDEECERIVTGFAKIMELSIAEQFVYPVDLDAFPLYAMMVNYPIDLTTIRERLITRYYRRINALLWDVTKIEENAKFFNEPGSKIVKDATLVTELCQRFIDNSDCTDPITIYHELCQDGMNHRGGRARGQRSRRGDEQPLTNGYDGTTDEEYPEWQRRCELLIDEILVSQESVPFRQPPSVTDLPDYLNYVKKLMDFTTVQAKVKAHKYHDVEQFCDDCRLVVKNSRAYNTNTRSKIYSITLRLSSYLENKIESLLKELNSTTRKRRLPNSEQPAPKRVSRRRKVSSEDEDTPSTSHMATRRQSGRTQVVNNHANDYDTDTDDERPSTSSSAPRGGRPRRIPQPLRQQEEQSVADSDSDSDEDEHEDEDEDEDTDKTECYGEESDEEEEDEEPSPIKPRGRGRPNPRLSARAQPVGRVPNGNVRKNPSRAARNVLRIDESSGDETETEGASEKRTRRKKHRSIELSPPTKRRRRNVNYREGQ